MTNENQKSYAKNRAAKPDCLPRLVGRRVRLKDKMPLIGWTVSTRNRLRGTVVADINYSTATVRIAAADSWDGKDSESDHAKTDLKLLAPPNMCKEDEEEELDDEPEECPDCHGYGEFPGDPNKNIFPRCPSCGGTGIKKI